MIRHAARQAVGWCGVTAILGAYAASNFGLLEFGGGTYQLLNITGALALVVDSWPDRNWPIVTINVAWAAIGLIVVFT